jgi:hypothetical protein
LATQTLLSGKDKPKTASEELEGLPDSLVKESEAELKKESADLKKSEAVVGDKENKKDPLNPQFGLNTDTPDVRGFLEWLYDPEVTEAFRKSEENGETDEN